MRPPLALRATRRPSITALPSIPLANKLYFPEIIHNIIRIYAKISGVLSDPRVVESTATGHPSMKVVQAVMPHLGTAEVLVMPHLGHKVRV